MMSAPFTENTPNPRSMMERDHEVIWSLVSMHNTHVGQMPEGVGHPCSEEMLQTVWDRAYDEFTLPGKTRKRLRPIRFDHCVVRMKQFLITLKGTTTGILWNADILPPTHPFYLMAKKSLFDIQREATQAQLELPPMATQSPQEEYNGKPDPEKKTGHTGVTVVLPSWVR